jgi:hypothetical protein
MAYPLLFPAPAKILAFFSVQILNKFERFLKVSAGEFIFFF